MEERTQVRGPTNGSARVRSLAAAGGVPYDDPMSKVLGLDAKTSGVGAWFGFTSGGTLLFVGLIALASVIAAVQVRTHVVSAPPAEIDIQEEAPPPPPPPTATAEPEQKPEPAPPPVHAAPKEAPPPPPAPAQAAKVLTQEPDPNEPVDLTANTIVQGNADAYAGGFTTSNGTGTSAVRSAPSPTGVPGGTGPVQAKPAPAVQGPDRSRLAGPGNSDWSNCPFPPEADTAQVDDAYVTIQVDVRPDGSPGAVRIISDPGNGFGREARRCAMNKRYQTALDHDGNPVAGTSKPFRVHFSR